MHYHRKSSFSIRGLEERVTVPQVGAPGKLFFLQTRHILQWSHTALASKWTSFDGAANKATVFCCCANTFLSFFIWPPANYTCYFCLGNLLSWKRKYEILFRENHWNSLAGSIRVTSFRNITTKLSLIKWKYSDWGKTLLKSNQQNFHKPSFINLIFTSHLFPKKTIFLALTILLHVPSNHVPHYLSTRLIKISKMRAQTHSLFKLLLSLKEDFLKFKFKYLHSLSLAFLDTQSNCCFSLFDSLFVSFDINIFFLF